MLEDKQGAKPPAVRKATFSLPPPPRSLSIAIASFSIFEPRHRALLRGELTRRLTVLGEMPAALAAATTMAAAAKTANVLRILQVKLQKKMPLSCALWALAQAQEYFMFFFWCDYGRPARVRAAATGSSESLETVAVLNEKDRKIPGWFEQLLSDARERLGDCCRKWHDRSS